MKRDPLDMTGKVVIVTGGCRGIGKAIAARFLERGARVVVCCRHSPGDHVGGPKAVTYLQADVREPAAIDQVVAATVEREGRIDVLVNNAGGSPFADAATASARFFQSIIALNLTAPLVFSQRVNAIMQTQESGGAIVNVASVSGTRPSPGTAAYGAAKAGLLNLTESLAVEWAPKVRVNAITAGLVETESAGAHYGGAEGVAAVAATVPIGRMATPDDVADACLFFASDLARYVTGASLLVHGGGERPAFLVAAEAAAAARTAREGT